MGEGVEIARDYHARTFPTFILTAAAGEVIDRWHGYSGTDGFLSALDAALADRTTIGQKLTRFREHPTAGDAVKLGDLRNHEGLFAEAGAFYARARDLDPAADVTMRIFEATLFGTKAGLFTFDRLVERADAVFASPKRTADEMIGVATHLKKLAAKEGQADLYVRYLKQAVEETEGVTEGKAAKVRPVMLADYALHVEGNAEVAVERKRASMPEGWRDDPNQLNNFACWCFENRINLEDAEAAARRGVERAHPGNEKANILDTLAEICNLKGDCGDAVEYIRMAVAEDPDSEYFREQLVRFQELLAGQ